MPRPFGAQSILYGDKVINIVNQKRRDVWPALDGDAYIANGDLGIVKRGQARFIKIEKMTGIRREAKPRGRPRLAPDTAPASQEQGGRARTAKVENK